MKFETFRWLFPVAITVHNLEETIWLPGWSQNVGKWHPPVGRYEFWFAVGVLTALAYVLMGLSIRHGKQSLATALIINLPITAFTWRFAVRDGFVSEKRCLLDSLGVSVVLLASVPGLFFLGKHLFGPSA